uniref:Uncharacterized protein n=1 Tax=Coccolithus braarudii TaxID=221442 RepID=A0A7S0QB77_9EUKA|mmetsp:Transcript_6741/g.14700  ORF Transcript_6741/g.14700 Transcript_6741/m.14700 type:complete len:102 (+) Transcript_6741:502-807(+)
MNSRWRSDSSIGQETRWAFLPNRKHAFGEEVCYYEGLHEHVVLTMCISYEHVVASICDGRSDVCFNGIGVIYAIITQSTIKIIASRHTCARSHTCHICVIH